jgi:hypothetical protein
VDPGESFLPESQKIETEGKRKNYPIFWEGKGKGNPQLKKNENRKKNHRLRRLKRFHRLPTGFRRLSKQSADESIALQNI